MLEKESKTMNENSEPTTEQLKADLENAQEEWLKEYTRRRKAEKTLECCLELIKHLQK